MSRRTTIATLAFALLAGPALAEPTAITIRAISHDGKFIGDSMGGVRVRLTEAASGRELAAGITDNSQWRGERPRRSSRRSTSSVCASPTSSSTAWARVSAVTRPASATGSPLGQPAHVGSMRIT